MKPADALVLPGSTTAPWLVWLHGFLGSHSEWLPLANQLTSYPQLLPDLPGHGAAQNCQATSFASVSARLQATLEHYAISRYWLIGYSLGGRIAMYHACYGNSQGLQGLIVEGAHPGLTSPAQRQARHHSDSLWAQRFRQQPLTQVLNDWYRQPVFASLTPHQRTQLVALRASNNPQALAAMLLATSLAHQPDLRTGLSRLTIPFHYLCGEYDSKFRALAQSLAIPCGIISSAGHNAHRENPGQVMQHLAAILHTQHKDAT